MLFLYRVFLIFPFNLLWVGFFVGPKRFWL